MKRSHHVTVAGLAADPRVQSHPSHMRALWSIHVRGCLRREIPNLITIDDYAALTRRPCHYCGCPPLNPTKFRGGDPILYNGVDRVDNARPYELDNLVACCKRCNAMKSSRDPEEFLRDVVRVARHLGWTPPADWFDP